VRNINESLIDWFRDTLHGLGSYSQDGNTYEGNFVNGKANGVGKFVSASGDSYEGESLLNVKPSQSISRICLFLAGKIGFI